MVGRLRRVPGSTDPLALRTLCKVELQDDLPHFDGMEDRLLRHLARQPNLRHLTHFALASIAEALVDLMLRAASKAREPHLKDYCALLRDPQDAATRAVIEGKRVDRTRLVSLFRQHSTAEALLRSRSPVLLQQLPRGMARLERKMAAGQVPVENIELLKDQKYATEYLLAEWLGRHGEARATQQYEHVEMIVKNECREAYDAARPGGEPFGQKMLAEVRRRVRQRYDQDHTRLFDCSYEHLLGLTGILTEECKVWWSEPFELPEEGTL